MIHNEEREREQRRQLQAARRRNRAWRWSRKTKATVTHPDHGSVVVPHGSNLAAIECAAELWGVMPCDIARDAEVRYYAEETERNDPGGIESPQE